MKKRILLLLVSISLVLFTTISSFANTSQINESSKCIGESIIVDGETTHATNYDIYINQDGIRIYPLRLIAENFGAKVSWEPSKNSALIENYNGEIWLNPATKTIVLNGVDKKLKQDIKVINSRTYVPAEFISKILGARFKFDENTKTISLEKPSPTLETLDLSDPVQKIKKDALVSYLTSLELNRNFSGQVLVVDDGNILIDRSYGYQDYENQIKAFNTTTFAIGSTTKQFTAAAIMKLAEKNKLSYDDKISKYLSDVPFGDQITIHELLTHTSGLYNYTLLVSDLLDSDVSELTYEKLIALIKDKPLDFEPGTNWSYSNTGYLVLGQIVEKVSGKTLEIYLQENIFDPIGMNDTGIAYRLEEKIVEANGYTGHMEVIQDSADRVLLNMAYGAGYLCSTAQNLYKWNVALQSGKVISKESLDRMFGKSPDMKLLVPYAYGWFINKGEYGEEISHGGNTIGFTSENAIFTEKNAQIIILTNKGYAHIASIKKDIVKILKGEVVNPIGESAYIVVSEEQMAKYVGKYEIKDLLKMDIFTKDGKLMFQAENQPAIEFDALSETEFESLSVDIKLIFDSKDTPKAFILHQAGMQYNAVKVK